MIAIILSCILITVILLALSYADDRHSLDSFWWDLVCVIGGCAFGLMLGLLIYGFFVPEAPLELQKTCILVPYSDGSYYKVDNDKYSYNLRHIGGGQGLYSASTRDMEIKKISDDSTPRLEVWKGTRDMWHKRTEDSYILYVPGGE